jgi:hypothetical protein
MIQFNMVTSPVRLVKSRIIGECYGPIAADSFISIITVINALVLSGRLPGHPFPIP